MRLGWIDRFAPFNRLNWIDQFVPFNVLTWMDGPPLSNTYIQSLFHGATANDARRPAVQANIQKLQSAWAERGWPILGVSGGVVRTLDGSPPGPTPLPSLVDPDASAFITSNLDYVLRRIVGTSNKPRCFVVAGNGAERAVESTVRDGSDKGYIISVATDAILGSSPAAEARAQYNLKGFARIRTTDQILSEVAAAQPSSSSSAGPGAPRAGKTALLVIDVQVRGGSLVMVAAAWIRSTGCI